MPLTEPCRTIHVLVASAGRIEAKSPDDHAVGKHPAIDERSPVSLATIFGEVYQFTLQGGEADLMKRKILLD